LSDLVRVTLKERDAFGNTVIMRRPRGGGTNTQFLKPTFPLPPKSRPSASPEAAAK
jgi:hypothetical protein